MIGLVTCRFRDLDNQVRRRELRRHRLEWFRTIYAEEKRVDDEMRSTADAATHSHKDWVDVVDDLMRSSVGVDLAEADINPADLRRVYANGYSAEQAVGILLDNKYEIN